MKVLDIFLKHNVLEIDTNDEHFKGLIMIDDFYGRIIKSDGYKHNDWFVVMYSHPFDKADIPSIRTEIYILYKSMWRPLSRTYGLQNPMIKQQ
jgi:hypothetical protein